MRIDRIIRTFIVLAAGTLLLAACVPASTPAPAVQPTTAAAPTTVPASTAAAPSTSAAPAGQITVTDDANRSVTFASSPQRIASLAPSTTEIAFALGLADRMVAVDTFSDYPPEVKSLPKITTSPLNVEQVVALKPDLVLAAGLTSADDIKKMTDLKLTVLVVGSSTTTFNNVTADIALLGKVTGTDAQARSIANAMQQKVDAVKAKIATAQSHPRVYWELDGTDPANPFTPGPGSFVNDIIDLAGGTNVAADAKSPWAQINAEQVIAGNPDIIILSDYAYGISVESVKARKGWSSINAVKNDKVFPIDDNLVSRPGPRIVDGLEAAAKLIHPELFK